MAEQVEKVDRDLVARGDQGKPDSVRYEAVNAMLLNEFLKAHRTIEARQAILAEQEKEIGALQQALKDQTAQIQKVSAQLETTKPAARLVEN